MDIGLGFKPPIGSAVDRVGFRGCGKTRLEAGRSERVCYRGAIDNQRRPRGGGLPKSVQGDARTEVACREACGEATDPTHSPPMRLR